MERYGDSGINLVILLVLFLCFLVTCFSIFSYLRRHQEELKLKQKMELEILRQSHQKEIQAMVSKFSNAQSFLQAKVVALEAE